MRLAVMAVDFDGTIAHHDVMDPDIRPAIAAARHAGIRVLLVTGRILGDLRRVAGNLHFVDAVVAENGAVLHFPDTGHTSLLAPPIHEEFVRELERSGIHFARGRSIIDASAEDAHRLLEVIRRLELPLVLAFNGGRVMVLPQGVSKASGLRSTLDTLRISPRNMLALGDAENDHEMLRLAEVGVAVAWGSQALCDVADIVLEGTGPAAVSAYIRQLADTCRLPAPRRARRRLMLGYTEDGEEFSLAVLGRNVLVAGDARSGKSWTAGLLCEQLILYGYCVCVIDPEGDYRTLEALPGVIVLGGDDPPPTPRELLRALRYPDRSVVIDLSKRTHDEKMDFIHAVLPALNEIRQRTGLPHRIVLDEAHYFLEGHNGMNLLDLEQNGYTVVTYWASRLPKALLDATEVMIVTRQSNPTEIEILRERCTHCEGVDPARWAILENLRSGQAVALPVTAEAAGDLRLFTVAPRLTPHVRHREKYIDVPVAERQAFVFTDGRRARTLRQFVEVLEAASDTCFDGHLRRKDFSRWLADVFGDYPLATQVGALEAQYAAKPSQDAIPEIVAAIRSRYELIEEDPFARPGHERAGG